MHYTNIGKTDIKSSIIGFGAWAIGGWSWGGTNQQDAVKAINESIDNGVNLIDTAPAYGKGLSEEIVGKAIKGKRDKVIIATKCGLVWHTAKGEYFFDYDNGEKVYKYLGPESIKNEVEQSLKRLGTEYIDIYQTHWQDTTTPIEDTMEALMELKDEGKIRAIGASNANLDQLKQYMQAGQLDVDQEKYSLVDTEIEKEQLAWCRDNRITLFAYSPIAQGLLTGKIGSEREFKNGDMRKNDPRFSISNRTRVNKVLENDIKPIADEYNLTITQLSIAALISDGGIVALCGARNLQQAKENSEAGKAVIEKEDVRKIRDSLSALVL